VLYCWIFRVLLGCAKMHTSVLQGLSWFVILIFPTICTTPGKTWAPLLKSESQHVSFCIHLPILQRTRNNSDILDDIPPTLILSQAHPKRSENYKLDHVSFKRNLCFLSFPLSLHISPSLYIIHVHIYICIHTYTYIEAHNIYSY